VDGITYAREHWPWAGVFFIWYLRQVGDISPDKAEYYFQMLDPDFNPQPVYDAVKAAATGSSAAQATATVPLATEATPTTGAPATDSTATPAAPAATPGSTITPGLGSNAGSSTDNSVLTGIIALVVIVLIIGAGVAFWLSRRRA
jgi:hypothetical protein